jgi:DNA invertase Pin-like site-specific DNA recombinase
VNTLAEFEALGVAFVSVMDNLDLTTPAGRLTAHVISAMCEFERALIVERVRAGMAAARRRGKRLDRPRAIVNVENVRALAARGLSRRRIATELGVSSSTIQRVVAGFAENLGTSGSIEASFSAPLAATTGCA